MNDCQIIHYNGDITKLKVQCVVNASEIKSENIDEIKFRSEIPKNISVPIGVVKITNEHELSSPYVIYVNCPKISNDGEDHKLLSRCYLQALELAKNANINEIAFPCISTNEFGFDKYRAAQNAITSVKLWLNSPLNNNTIKKIIFVTNTDEDNAIYSNLINPNKQNDNNYFFSSLFCIILIILIFLYIIMNFNNRQ